MIDEFHDGCPSLLATSPGGCLLKMIKFNRRKDDCQKLQFGCGETRTRGDCRLISLQFE